MFESIFVTNSPFLQNKIITIPGFYACNDNFDMSGLSVFYQIPVICNDSDKLIDFLVINNIDIARQHIKNLANCKAYKKYSHKKFVNAEEISQKLILLPCYPELNSKNVIKISNFILKFYSI